MAGKKVDVIYIIDVESTCWNGQVPTDQHSEIIEIGLTAVNLHTRNIVDKKQYIVKPTHSKVSQFCTELTGWTQIRLDNDGQNFATIVGKMQTDFPNLRQQIWGSWGDYDRKMFVDNCRLHGIKYPFGPRHINIATLFAIRNYLTTECSVSQALKRLGLPFIGTPHSGISDSLNIANIFLKTI